MAYPQQPGQQQYMPPAGAPQYAPAQQPGYPQQQPAYGAQPGYPQPPPQAAYGAQPGYPPQQGAYPPPQQGAYPPPQQGAYPPPQQGAYPPPHQGAYPPPQQGAYPPQQGAYPTAQPHVYAPPQGFVRPRYTYQGAYSRKANFAHPQGLDPRTQGLFVQGSGIFRTFDRDHSGALNRGEFRNALRSNGLQQHHDMVLDRLFDMAAGSDKAVSEREFCEFWCNYQANPAMYGSAFGSVTPGAPPPQQSFQGGYPPQGAYPQQGYPQQYPAQPGY